MTIVRTNARISQHVTDTINMSEQQGGSVSVEGSGALTAEVIVNLSTTMSDQIEEIERRCVL